MEQHVISSPPEGVMQVKIIEATNEGVGGMNWGKFMLGRFTPEEWAYQSIVSPGRSLLSTVGWDRRHLLVVNLQTGEGSIFRPGGSAQANLNDKHQIWVCPMFEPFLIWLYEQDLTDLDKLPSLVEIKDPRSALAGHRRKRKT